MVTDALYRKVTQSENMYRVLGGQKINSNFSDNIDETEKQR